MFPLIWGVEPLIVLLPFIVVACLYVLNFLLANEGVSPQRLLFMHLSLIVVAIFGAKLFSLHVRGWQFNSLAAELEGGWRHPGVILALVIFTPLLKRLILPTISLLRYADLLVIALSFAFAMGRVGCFLAGCCTGAITQGALGLQYQVGSQVWYSHMQLHLINSSSPSMAVIPLHLYMMVASLLIGLFLIWFDKMRQYNGQVLLMYLFLHEGAKAVMEVYRVPFIQDLQTVSLLASGVGLAGLIVVALLSLKNNSNSIVCQQ
jgi:phosphatidylglycerol:prolipoprotein diacylglycerol transferase